MRKRKIHPGRGIKLVKSYNQSNNGPYTSCIEIADFTNRRGLDCELLDVRKAGLTHGPIHGMQLNLRTGRLHYSTTLIIDTLILKPKCFLVSQNGII